MAKSAMNGAPGKKKPEMDELKRSNMDGMNRRQFALASIVSSVAVVSGCDTESKPDLLATLLNNPAVHEAFKSLENAASSLESNVGDFETENWRDVVENVKTDSVDVSDGIEALKRALGYSNAQ